MIEKLRIKNFQRHERLDISFDSPVLAITGPTDTGKSSIIRALKWVVMNRPLGMGYIRNGSDRTDVSIKVDGVAIRRSRSQGQNSYQIKSNGKKRHFDAIGTDVPDAVQKVLNLGPENFQGQHDPSFWFSLSGSEVAKALNKIVDLSVIDEVASRFANAIRTKKVGVDILTKREDEAKAEVKRLEFVLELTENYNDLYGHLEAKEELEGIVSSLRDAIIRTERYYCVKKRRAAMAEESKQVIEVGERVVLYDKETTNLADIIRQVEGSLESVNQEVPDMVGLEQSQGLFEEANQLQEEMLELVTSIDSQIFAVQVLQGKQTAIEEDLTEKLDGMCPICGGKFDG